MALNLSEDLTSGVNWTWYESGNPLVEIDLGTKAPASSTTKTYTLRHDQENPVIIRGFYLSPIAKLGNYKPFTEKWGKEPQDDMYTALYWGDHYTDGLYMIQGADTVLFKSGVGSSRFNRLPFTLATDTGGGRVEGQEVITLGVKLVVPAVVPKVDYLHLNIEIDYVRVP